MSLLIGNTHWAPWPKKATKLASNYSFFAWLCLVQWTSWFVAESTFVSLVQSSKMVFSGEKFKQDRCWLKKKQFEFFLLGQRAGHWSCLWRLFMLKPVKKIFVLSSCHYLLDSHRLNSPLCIVRHLVMDCNFVFLFRHSLLGTLYGVALAYVSTTTSTRQLHSQTVYDRVS